MVTEGDLKACPFCGGKAVFIYFCESGAAVSCQQCEVETQFYGEKGADYDVGEDLAAAIWNKRL